MVQIRVVRASRIVMLALVVLVVVAAAGFFLRVLPALNNSSDSPIDEGVGRRETALLQLEGAQTSAPPSFPTALPDRGSERDVTPLMLASGELEEHEDDKTPDLEATKELEKIQLWVDGDDSGGTNTGSEKNPVESDRRSEGKRVLLYHTHTHEAYEQVAKDTYVETSKWRTADYAHSIVRVGDILTDALKGFGASVVHDTTDHEPPKLGTAYTRSLATLQGYVQRGQFFDLYIDLHRDAYSASAKSQMEATNVGGKECAKLMVLIGTGEGKKTPFAEKPDWKRNAAVAKAITEELDRIAPGLCRPVMITKERYNQHVNPNSILIEVGNNRNTLEQAENSMAFLAKALNKVLGSL